MLVVSISLSDRLTRGKERERARASAREREREREKGRKSLENLFAPFRFRRGLTFRSRKLLCSLLRSADTYCVFRKGQAFSIATACAADDSTRCDGQTLSLFGFREEIEPKGGPIRSQNPIGWRHSLFIPHLHGTPLRAVHRKVTVTFPVIVSDKGAPTGRSNPRRHRR